MSTFPCNLLETKELTNLAPSRERDKTGTVHFIRFNRKLLRNQFLLDFSLTLHSNSDFIK